MKLEQKLREIFLEALEIKDAQQRADYLGKVCGADAALRQRIERLIAAQNELGSFLGGAPGEPSGSEAGAPSEVPPFDPPDSGPSVGVEETISEKVGDLIGPYKLLQRIGEGGMGVVYMAEQDKPVHRRVALKIIKLGMDTKQVIARFEAEEQALAMMDHPNIAKVFEVGSTSVSMASPFVPGVEIRNRREFQKERVCFKTISNRPGGYASGCCVEQTVGSDVAVG